MKSVLALRDVGRLRIEKLVFSYQDACTWFFVCYIVSGLLRTVSYFVLSKFSLGWLYIPGAIMIMYFPMLMVLLYQLGRYKKFDKETGIFLAIYGVIALYFSVTLLIHPNYEQYYSRSYFGAYDAVFRPDSGALFGLLAVLVSKDTHRLLYNLKWTMPLLFIYILYQYYQYYTNGYWMVYDWTGEYIEQSYNLGFGYTAIFCAMIAISFFWKERKVWQIMVAGVSVVLAFLGGSRGCLLSLTVFLVVFLLKSFVELSFFKKLMLSLGIVFTYFILDLTFESIISAVSGVNSRIISMYLDGSIMSDYGRNEIYKIAWDAIKDLPLFGYGAYGDRVFIAPYYYWGYCHHIALEFIMDFGWLVGIIFLGFLTYFCIKAVFKAHGEQVMIVSVLIGANVKLFLSDSFWAYPQFWMLLGYVVFIMRRELKGDKKRLVIRRRLK